MKKLFSLVFVLLLIASVTTLVGCNGLWGFDDDDDVITPPGTKFSFAGAVVIPGDGVVSAPGDTNLRAAGVADGLKAEVWKKVAGKAEKVHEADVDKADGKYTLEFYGSTAYYFIKIVKPNDTLFKMLVVLGTVDEKSATQTKAVTPRTTAVGILMEKEGSTDEPAAYEIANGTDIGALEAVLTTPAAFGDIDTIVANVAFPIIGIALNKTNAAMLVGGANEALTVALTPAYASAATIVWESTVPAVASVVPATGVVSPVTAGVATISCTVTDKGGAVFKAECSITVTKAVISVSLDKENLNLFKGNTSTLIATINPADATNLNLTWESSNKAVADVDATGKVTAVEVGVATITVRTADGNKTATCGVKVAAVPVAITGIALNPTTLNVEIGKTGTLAIVYTPADANTQDKVEWKSDAETIATVVNGVVTPKLAGTAKITVTVTDNAGAVFTATADVVVTAPAKAKYDLVDPVSGAAVTVSDKAISTTIIKLGNVASDFVVTTSISDVNGKAWTLGKDTNLSTKYGTLVLKAVGFTVGEGFTAYSNFGSITFSTNLPANAIVTVIDINPDPEVNLAVGK